MWGLGRVIPDFKTSAKLILSVLGIGQGAILVGFEKSNSGFVSDGVSAAVPWGTRAVFVLLWRRVCIWDSLSNSLTFHACSLKQILSVCRCRCFVQQGVSKRHGCRGIVNCCTLTTCLSHGDRAGNVNVTTCCYRSVIAMSPNY